MSEGESDIGHQEWATVATGQPNWATFAINSAVRHE
jgi:hypothetical protein